MSRVQKLEAELEKLSPAELQEIRDWLENFLEDQLQFTEQFESQIQQSEREMHSGIHPSEFDAVIEAGRMSPHRELTSSVLNSIWERARSR